MLTPAAADSYILLELMDENDSIGVYRGVYSNLENAQQAVAEDYWWWGVGEWRYKQNVGVFGAWDASAQFNTEFRRVLRILPQKTNMWA